MIKLLDKIWPFKGGYWHQRYLEELISHDKLYSDYQHLLKQNKKLRNKEEEYMAFLIIWYGSFVPIKNRSKISQKAPGDDIWK